VAPSLGTSLCSIMTSVSSWFTSKTTAFTSRQVLRPASLCHFMACRHHFMLHTLPTDETAYLGFHLGLYFFLIYVHLCFHLILNDPCHGLHINSGEEWMCSGFHFFLTGPCIFSEHFSSLVIGLSVCLVHPYFSQQVFHNVVWHCNYTRQSSSHTDTSFQLKMP
jgi:hypothetical protein